jgi:hypothetical protein
MRGKLLTKVLPFITLLAMVFFAAGCQDLGTFPTTEPTAQPTASPPSQFINTADRATLAVYEHLLSLAESYEAKDYLAEFYTVSDNWSARSELLKDGTTVWHVEVDMSGVSNWQERPYWQQASWLVYTDGRVVPSSQFNADALRIEADLQELSLKEAP